MITPLIPVSSLTPFSKVVYAKDYEKLQHELDAAVALRDEAVNKLNHLRDTYLAEARKTTELPIGKRPLYSQEDIQPLLACVRRHKYAPEPYGLDAESVLNAFVEKFAPFPSVEG